MGAVVTELGNLNAVGVIGSCNGRGHVVALNHQRQGGFGQKSKSSNQNGLTCTDLVLAS